MDANEQFGKFYIEEGQIEPQYLTEEERKLLTDGMVKTLKRIRLAVYESNRLAKDIIGKPNEQLVKRMQETETLQDKLGYYLAVKPYIF